MVSGFIFGVGALIVIYFTGNAMVDVGFRVNLGLMLLLLL